MNRPTILENPNLDALIAICEEFFDFISSDDYHEDNDYNVFISEEAITVLYGDAAWEWINSQYGDD